MELIPAGTKIDFIGKGIYAIIFSLILVVGSIYIFISKGDEKYGIDFLGGHELVAKVSGVKSSDSIREALDSGGIKNSIVQSFELNSEDYSIRLPGDAGAAKEVREGVVKALSAAFPDKVEIKKSDFVGPAVGNELRTQAAIALTIGLIGMLLYISFRFELSYAMGAVVALFHDVTVCAGFYLLAGFSITMGTVAAALTIVGYSVNDTIVIFDRVREEVRKRKGASLREILNESVNITLSRTIVTSLLTFFSALSLLLIGGGAISDLSLFLVIGIIAGSYSTIFIASPIVLAWEKFRGR